MAKKAHLQRWLVESLQSRGGSASPVNVCRDVWQMHEPELRMSGDLFYTWQHDIRGAAEKLRDAGVLLPEDEAPRGIWRLGESGEGAVTLHEELARILRRQGNEWTHVDDLADAVNEAGIFRKRDGSAVTDFQVHGRTKNYPDLFERSGPRVRLRV
jgi:hypothetical protein